MYQFRTYCHPFERLELSVQKNIVIRSKDSSYRFQNNRQLFERLVAIRSKTQDVIRAKKKTKQQQQQQQQKQKTKHKTKQNKTKQKNISCSS